MVPVAISLIGTGLSAPTQLFIAWFGPRGLASLVFVGTVVFESSPEDYGEIIAIGAIVVGMSVVLHGLSAWPASIRYAAWFSATVSTPGAGDMPEAQSVEAMPPARLSRPMPHRR
jgi:NhaP-type Na+/H+ or K+/H+ antiporter